MKVIGVGERRWPEAIVKADISVLDEVPDIGPLASPGIVRGNIELKLTQEEAARAGELFQPKRIEGSLLVLREPSRPGAADGSYRDLTLHKQVELQKRFGKKWKTHGY